MVVVCRPRGIWYLALNSEVSGKLDPFESSLFESQMLWL